MPTTYVLYHAHCADGFGAAYAAWCALGSDGVQYLPLSHGDLLPAIPDGSRVYILDFSFDRETMLALDRRVELTVIDHHKTAQEALAGLPFAIFDMHRSGAVMAWHYFQGTGNCLGWVPALLLYVQDRDLWRWELQNSREVSAGLALVEKDFAAWDQLRICDLIESGTTALRLQQMQVKSMIARSRSTIFKIDGREEQIRTVNTQILRDECCEAMLAESPAARFVAAYYDGPMGRTWSLRSRPDFDVSKVARSLKGGGHAQAAGFTDRFGTGCAGYIAT